MMESFTIYPKFILVLFQVKNVSFLQITTGGGGKRMLQGIESIQHNKF